MLLFCCLKVTSILHLTRPTSPRCVYVCVLKYAGRCLEDDRASTAAWLKFSKKAEERPEAAIYSLSRRPHRSYGTRTDWRSTFAHDVLIADSVFFRQLPLSAFGVFALWDGYWRRGRRCC